tara:strand:- start:227 stop:421 length:195 start_codon:yes stop_codon:yes gene_type:complete
MDTIHYHNGDRVIRSKQTLDVAPSKPYQPEPKDPRREKKLELYRVRAAAGLGIFTGLVEGDEAA